MNFGTLALKITNVILRFIPPAELTIWTLGQSYDPMAVTEAQTRHCDWQLLLPQIPKIRPVNYTPGAN